VRNACKILRTAQWKAEITHHTSFCLGKPEGMTPTFERVIHLFKTKGFLNLTLCGLVDESTKLLDIIFQKTYIEFVFIF
jgi:hypothetical protein